MNGFKSCDLGGRDDSPCSMWSTSLSPRLPAQRLTENRDLIPLERFHCN